jgi:hypothetical protein
LKVDIQKIAQAASRACEDPAFAWEILEEKQDYPEVRQAILKDLAEANQVDAQELTVPSDQVSPDILRDYVRNGGRLAGSNVARLSERAKSW